jgi:hypothetical protein
MEAIAISMRGPENGSLIDPHSRPSQLAGGGGGSGVATSASRSCVLTGYVNGMKWSPLNLDDFTVDDVEAIEIYRGSSELPARYATMGNACGVILIWTRMR